MDFARGCMFMAGMAVAAVGVVDGAKAAPINTVTRETGPVSASFSSPLDMLFDPIEGAFDLVSIGAGSITTQEGGGTFDISVIYFDDTTASVGTFGLGDNATLLLASLPDAGFAPFALGTVKGLRLSYLTGGWSFATNVSIPASTVVTFAAVPLPATLALLPLGALALGAVGRRRRQPANGAASA
jgi:hypothetical protein